MLIYNAHSIKHALIACKRTVDPCKAGDALIKMFQQTRELKMTNKNVCDNFELYIQTCLIYVKNVYKENNNNNGDNNDDNNNSDNNINNNNNSNNDNLKPGVTQVIINCIDLIENKLIKGYEVIPDVHMTKQILKLHLAAVMFNNINNNDNDNIIIITRATNYIEEKRYTDNTVMDDTAWYYVFKMYNIYMNNNYNNDINKDAVLEPIVNLYLGAINSKITRHNMHKQKYNNNNNNDNDNYSNSNSNKDKGLIKRVENIKDVLKLIKDNNNNNNNNNNSNNNDNNDNIIKQTCLKEILNTIFVKKEI